MRRLVPVLVLLLPACNTAPVRDCAGCGDLAALKDVAAAADTTVPVYTGELCEKLAAKVGRPGKPENNTHRTFDALVLSGGGAYGAYTAGVLCGWTEAGTRPKFDVVTGVSTGALVATLAFLGPERDADLKRCYTTIRTPDIYIKKNEIRGLLSDSLADNGPLAEMIAKVVDQKLLTDVAAEHAKGRRLYVGTTHLDSKRLVTWDMGAIAARGTPGDLDLFRRLLLASAAIPGFFPPVKVPVAINGVVHDELHVDGGVTASLFLNPPHVTPEEAKTLGAEPLAGSNVYILVAGKLYADPGCTKANFIGIAQDSISALLYAQTRGDLFKLFALCLVSKMNYYLTSIPADLPAPADATTFDPVEMTALFEAGRKNAGDAAAWRSSPPGVARGETLPPRAGIAFTK